MNRDEFTSLPLPLVLGLLWDKGSAIREAMEKIPAPKSPRPPKYDQAIYRKDGVTWASEYDAEGLRYWQRRYAEGAVKPDNKYAEQDQKRAKQLGFWLTWRLCNPFAVWSGERNREQVTASTPTERPFVYERQPKRDEQAEERRGFTPAFSDDEPDYGSDGDSDSPF